MNTATHRLLTAVLLVTGLSSLACTTVIDGIFFDGAVARRKEKRKDLKEYKQELLKEYASTRDEIKETTAATKQKIDAHIEAGEIGLALQTIKVLHDDIHEGDAYKEKRYALVKKEGFEQREWIQDASARALAAVDAIMARGEFARMDEELEQRLGLPIDGELAAKFAAKHASIKTAWMDHLSGEIGRLEKKAPGLAAVYALQGELLAKQVEDAALAEQFARSYNETSKRVISTYQYVVVPQGPRNGSERAVLNSVKGTDWSPSAISLAPQRGAKPSARLIIQFGSPSYRPYQKNTTDSFQYQSGTKQVRNPAHGRLRRKVKEAKDDMKRAQSDMTEQQRRLDSNANCPDPSSNSSCASGLRAARRDYAAAQENYQEASSEMSNAQNKLSSTPAELTEPVHSQQSYPVKLHILDASVPYSVQLISERGLKKVTLNKRLEASLVDREHAAHSRNDGSVSADSASPPTERDALRKLEQDAVKLTVEKVRQGFGAYHATKLPGQGEDRAAQTNALAIYLLLDPVNASPEAVARLEHLADITDARGLVTSR